MLKYVVYNILFGFNYVCIFGEIDEVISVGIGEKKMLCYCQIYYDSFLQMQDCFKDLIGFCNKCIVLKVICLYGYFVVEEVLFDNQCLIEEGMWLLQLFIDYVILCECISKDIFIVQQMKYDYKI